MIVVPLALLAELATATRSLNLEILASLVIASCLMAVPTWIGTIVSVYAPSSGVRGVAAVAAAVTFILSLWVAYDVVTSASSTAGVAFVFWPIIASVILGTVIGIGAGADYLDRRR
jgi:hypothetical protein